MFFITCNWNADIHHRIAFEWVISVVRAVRLRCVCVCAFGPDTVHRSIDMQAVDARKVHVSALSDTTKTTFREIIAQMGNIYNGNKSLTGADGLLCTDRLKNLLASIINGQIVASQEPGARGHLVKPYFLDRQSI